MAGFSVSKVPHGKDWWEHVSPGGNVMWCGRKVVPMSELIELDEMPDLPEPDEWEDPDSDGYGWERKALRGIY